MKNFLHMAHTTKKDKEKVSEHVQKKQAHKCSNIKCSSESNDLVTAHVIEYTENEKMHDVIGFNELDTKKDYLKILKENALDEDVELITTCNNCNLSYPKNFNVGKEVISTKTNQKVRDYFCTQKDCLNNSECDKHQTNELKK